MKATKFIVPVCLWLYNNDNNNNDFIINICMTHDQACMCYAFFCQLIFLHLVSIAARGHYGQLAEKEASRLARNTFLSPI